MQAWNRFALLLIPLRRGRSCSPIAAMFPIANIPDGCLAQNGQIPVGLLFSLTGEVARKDAGVFAARRGRWTIRDNILDFND